MGYTDLPPLPDGPVRGCVCFAGAVDEEVAVTDEDADSKAIGAGASWVEGGAVGAPIFSSSRDTTWRSRMMINLDELIKG